MIRVKARLRSIRKLIWPAKSSWWLRYCRFRWPLNYQNFRQGLGLGSFGPDSSWRTYTEQFWLKSKSVILLKGSSLEIMHRFPSFFLRWIQLMTELMLLQIETIILLLFYWSEYWLQLAFWRYEKILKVDIYIELYMESCYDIVESGGKVPESF